MVEEVEGLWTGLYYNSSLALLDRTRSTLSYKHQVFETFNP